RAGPAASRSSACAPGRRTNILRESPRPRLARRTNSPQPNPQAGEQRMPKAKAIRIDKTGGPEVMKYVEVDVGEPGPGEVQVRHHAIGVNYIDVYFRTGLYPQPLPGGIGLEGAGVVTAVGEGVTHVKVGDR